MIRDIACTEKIGTRNTYIAFAFNVCISEEASLLYPRDITLRAYSPVLAVIDEILVDNKAKISD